MLLRQRDATGLITFDDDVRTVAAAARPPQPLAPAARRRWATLEAGQGTAAEPALRRVVDQLRRRGLVVFVSDLLLDRALALKALRFLRHRGHQVLVLHLMDPAEVDSRRSGGGALRGPGDPRGRRAPPAGLGRRLSRDGPRRWSVTGGWPAAATASRYHRVTTDTPFGIVLREALAPPVPGGMIGFLHPWALAGLAAAAIPVLLHLLARREPPTVVFPAVRYLITTTREHQRRLKLQNLLLLLLRTLLIVALVLAAAGPTLPRRGVAGHAPSALVLMLDNSPSSGAVVAGIAPAGAAPGRPARAGAGPGDAGGRALAAHRGRRSPPRRQPRAGRPGRRARGVAPAARSRRRARGWPTRCSRRSRARARSCCSPTSRPAPSPRREPAVPLVVGRPDDPPPPNVGHRAARRPARSPGRSDGGRLTVTSGRGLGRGASR